MMKKLMFSCMLLYGISTAGLAIQNDPPATAISLTNGSGRSMISGAPVVPDGSGPVFSLPTHNGWTTTSSKQNTTPGIFDNNFVLTPIGPVLSCIAYSSRAAIPGETISIEGMTRIEFVLTLITPSSETCVLTKSVSATAQAASKDYDDGFGSASNAGLHKIAHASEGGTNELWSFGFDQATVDILPGLTEIVFPVQVDASMSTTTPVSGSGGTTGGS